MHRAFLGVKCSICVHQVQLVYGILQFLYFLVDLLPIMEGGPLKSPTIIGLFLPSILSAFPSCILGDLLLGPYLGIIITSSWWTLSLWSVPLYLVTFFFLVKVYFVLGCLGDSSQLSAALLISARVMISWFVRSSPTTGSVLTVQSLLGILSPSISAPLLLVLAPSLSLSLSK